MYVIYFNDRVDEVRQALEPYGLREETVVILAADHGVSHLSVKWAYRRPSFEVALLVNGLSPVFSDCGRVDEVICCFAPMSGALHVNGGYSPATLWG